MEIHLKFFKELQSFQQADNPLYLVFAVADLKAGFMDILLNDILHTFNDFLFRNESYQFFPGFPMIDFGIP